jgi:ESCRT-II complex subunit VPS22
MRGARARMMQENNRTGNRENVQEEYSKN